MIHVLTMGHLDPSAVGRRQAIVVRPLELGHPSACRFESGYLDHCDRRPRRALYPNRQACAKISECPRGMAVFSEREVFSYGHPDYPARLGRSLSKSFLGPPWWQTSQPNVDETGRGRSNEAARQGWPALSMRDVTRPLQQTGRS
jgi:hypothetical protein